MSGWKLTVFGVQPLMMRRANHILSLSDLMLQGKHELSDRDIGDEAPPWVTELEGLYPNRHFRYQRIEGLVPLPDDAGCREMTAYLCSNTVLNQHLVVFELRGQVGDPAGIDAEALRALLVKPSEAAEDRRPRAVRDALDRAMQLIARNHREAGSREPYAPGDLRVERDSCNITLFLDSGQPDCIRRAESREWSWDLQAHLHDGAERISTDRLVLPVSDDTRVYFGGRMHHVVSSSEQDVYVIKQIMLMLQVMWFFVPCYLRAASRWHRQIVDERLTCRLDELEWAAKRLIHVYQTVHLQNEFAKHAFGVLCGVVYEPCQQRWGVERSIEQFERFATFFRAFIHDVREAQSVKSERMLNYVLAGLGLFGVVGLWADILDSETAARDLGSWQKLWQLATDTALGWGTLVFLGAAITVAFGLIMHGMHVRRSRRGGRRWRRRNLS